MGGNPEAPESQKEGGFPLFELIVSARAALRLESDDIKKTDDIHREALKAFSIQVL